MFRHVSRVCAPRSAVIQGFKQPIIKFSTHNATVPLKTHGTTKWKVMAACAIAGGAFYLYQQNHNDTGYAHAATKPEVYVHKIVLTGGPCGGKSTALANLATRLRSLGYDVYMVPEVATMLISGGTSLGGRNREGWIGLQIQIMKLQRALEDGFEQVAKLGDKPAVMLCDRGLCDNRAYCSKEDFDLILDVEGVQLNDIRDRRYDAVFHLVTAAIGAEDFYTTSNNAARSESLEEARTLDYKVLDAWVGHPNLRVVDNSTTFDEKITRVVNGISKAIGAIPSLPERRFLLDPSSTASMISPELTVEQFQVETIIIQRGSGAQDRITRRSQGRFSTYTISSSSPSNGGLGRVVESHQISGKDFLIHLNNPLKHVVRKKISYFLWNGKYYALNEYQEPQQFVALEVEASPSTDISTLVPPFFTPIKDITRDEAYSSEGVLHLRKK